MKDKTPQDDEGINSELILESCDISIKYVWNKLQNTKNIDTDEMFKLINIAYSSWSLADEIINRSLYNTLDDLQDEDEFFNDEDYDI